jgi:hypothetical protein
MNDQSFSGHARPSERLSKSGAWNRARSTVLLWLSDNRIIAQKYGGLEKKSAWRMFSACPVDMEVQRSMRRIAPNNDFRPGFKGAGERVWKRRWRRSVRQWPVIFTYFQIVTTLHHTYPQIAPNTNNPTKGRGPLRRLANMSGALTQREICRRDSRDVRFAPESDRLLCCREMTRWANRVVIALQQIRRLLRV